MVTFLHISDTHLGCTARNIRNMTIKYLNMNFQPIEFDFARAYWKIITYALDHKDEIEFVVHSGDFYHFPYLRNPYPPSEASRNIAVKGLKRLERAGIPIIIIDGNHGIFHSRRTSTIQSFEVLENVRVVSFWGDLINVLSGNKKQMLVKLPEKECMLHCFPFVNPRYLRSLSEDIRDAYLNWLKTYDISGTGVTEIGVIHGMKLDETLPAELLDIGFDYLAVGHNHRFEKIKDNAYNAGAPERWRFDEVDQEKVILNVQAEHNEAPKVTPIPLESRPMLSTTINANTEDTPAVVLEKIQRFLNTHKLATGFDFGSAYRVKIGVKGDMPHTFWARFNTELTELHNALLRTEDYNILQFSIGRVSEPVVEDFELAPGEEVEYLIDNPENDFRQFIEKLSPEDYDIELLIKLFSESVKRIEQT
ncbi:MAG: exonuclease SbcCD subunit D [Promethearchaeota archaeon]